VVVEWMLACLVWILATAEVGRIAVTANAAIKVFMANSLYDNRLSQAAGEYRVLFKAVLSDCKDVPIGGRCLICQ
jgi:hypothetical protein